MRPPEGQMPGTPSPDPISTRRRRIALRVRGLTAAQRIHGTRSRVPELGTPGSVGGRGGKPPRPTRPVGYGLYVALDEWGRPRAVPPLRSETEAERRRD